MGFDRDRGLRRALKYLKTRRGSIKCACVDQTITEWGRTHSSVNVPVDPAHAQNCTEPDVGHGAGGGAMFNKGKPFISDGMMKGKIRLGH